MIRITITGERYPIPKVAILSSDFERQDILDTINDAYEKEQALQFELVDGSTIYLPAVTLIHGVSDIQVEVVGG